MQEPPFDLLSRFWLREPDPETLALAHEVPSLALHIGDARELSTAYTDLFLLNVYPYGTVFTDFSGELNGPAASATGRRYEARGFSPRQLLEAGAPDHVGLCLAFLDHLAERGEEDPPTTSWFLEWIPVCCLAVERDPSAHAFYRALAAVTRARLLERMPGPTASPRAEPEDSWRHETQEELSLSDVVRFFLAPARSGFFLSRSRMARIVRAAGLSLPFGSRFDVARGLFAAAGESGRVRDVLRLLEEELFAWEEAYRGWPQEFPIWKPFAAKWLSRASEGRKTLARLRETLDTPLELEYSEGEAGLSFERT